MIQFFILQLTTIAFEKKYNNINDDDYNDFKEYKYIKIYNGIFVLSLLLFFYISISFGSLVNHFKKKMKSNVIKGLIEIISNDILNGQYGILIFNSFYCCSLSIISILKGLDEKITL